MEGYHKVIVFAVGWEDAQTVMTEYRLEFEKTVWVMNKHLLGGMDLTGWTYVCSEAFKKTPAYQDLLDENGKEVVW